MTIDASNINSLWGTLIVEELIRNGIDYFIISIGSRSTPLTVAVARNKSANKQICFDERAAAFHALGYARATGKPAVVICTSGSAAANYFPAIIEASTDGVPMIVLSADRPPELRLTGANQTIQQFNLYGQYAKWQFDLPCPDEKIAPQMVLTTIDQAIHQATKSPCGVVHLNCMFREPLAPSNAYISEMYLASLNRWQEHEKPYTQYSHSISLPDTASINEIADIINQTQRGILAVGQLKSSAEVEAVLQLAKKLNFSVFADIQSGIRLDNSLANVINYYDQLLLTDFCHQLNVETILQVGSRITSKRFLQFLDKHPPKHHIAVIDDPFRHDATHTVSLRIDSDITHFCQLILMKINNTYTYESNWVKKLNRQSQLVNQCVDDFLLPREDITEPGVTRIISRYMSKEHGLFIASSMPIRDMDMYASCEGSPLAVASNRGTSGIEGTIATGAGFAAGLKAPVTVLVGDLAFLYDLNSLALLKTLSQPIIVVVVNNNGGGIFSFLPIAKFQDVFEQYFGAPHDIEFEHAVKTFGIDYYHPDTSNAFLTTYQTAVNNQRPAVIEVTTNRDENYALHQNLQKQIISKLQEINMPVLEHV
jgi:2-succinyl-5-enolpyruvyl-6-hydroxy-3-cyclohexene-1-carboxylate synthase